MNCSYLKNPSQNVQIVNSIFYYLVFKKFSNYFLFAANIFLIILFHMYCIVRSSRLLLLYSSLFSFFSSSFLSIYLSITPSLSHFLTLAFFSLCFSIPLHLLLLSLFLLRLSQCSLSLPLLPVLLLLSRSFCFILSIILLFLSVSLFFQLSFSLYSLFILK